MINWYFDIFLTHHCSYCICDFLKYMSWQVLELTAWLTWDRVDSISITLICQREFIMASFLFSIAFTKFSSLFSPWFSFLSSSCIWIKDTAPTEAIEANSKFQNCERLMSSQLDNRSLTIAYYLRLPSLVTLSSVLCLVPTLPKKEPSYTAYPFQVLWQLFGYRYNQLYVAWPLQKLKSSIYCSIFQYEFHKYNVLFSYEPCSFDLQFL